MRRLLWIGDAVAATGFARSTHAVLDVLRETWDVHVLGINYLGDPHKHPYDIYPAYPGGDAFGVRRTPKLVKKLQPDLVVLQNDPWNLAPYTSRLKDTPYVCVVPVDGLNCQGAPMNGAKLTVFWTEFGRREAEKGGHVGPAAVIPLGVDLDVYKPGDRLEARRALNMTGRIGEVFIVGNINRNQPRKRLDLTVRYFAEWLREYRVKDAYLYLHLCPTGDEGCDIPQLTKYYGIEKNVIFVEPELGQGDPEERVVQTYRAFDVQVSTTQGEGMGLTTLEGMACGIRQVVPDWAALGDWANDGSADLVWCSSVAVTPNNVNVIGGIPDQDAWIKALHGVYCQSDEERDRAVARCLALAADPRFRWRNIGEAWRDALDEVTSAATAVEAETAVG